MHIQITAYTIWMTLIWSSILIWILYCLRKSARLVNVCSVSGIVGLYIFCIIRLCFPLEFGWTKVIPGKNIYNFLFRLMRYQLIQKSVFSISFILSVIWIIGIIIKLMIYIKNYICINKYFQALDSEEAKEAIQIFEKIEDSNKHVKIVKSSAITTPFCMGIIDQKIILPNKNYSEEELFYILMHENAHLKNRDLLIKLLINVACAIYWWNPIVYLLKKDLNQTLEIRCDNYVVNHLSVEQRCMYLETLLKEFKSETFSQEKKTREIVSYFYENHSQALLERFQVIAQQKHQKLKKSPITIIITGLVLLLSYLFVIQPQYEAPILDIETSEDTYAVTADNSYIIKQSDNTYLLHNMNFEVMLNIEEANCLIREGFYMVE